MCGTVNKISNAISTVTDSTAFKVAFPVQAIAQGATKLATGAVGINGGAGLSSGEQYLAGAAGGTAIGAAGAAGAFGASAPASAGAGAGSALGSGAAGSSGLKMMQNAGGIPLLTKVLLGGSVAATVASFFGKKPGDDYQNWLNQLSQQEQAQVKQMTDNLTQVQGDVSARQQAVSHVVDNYPHIVDQALQEINSGGLGATLDANSKLALDKASDQLAAKYSAQGGFSSGAFNQGLAKEATALTIATNQDKIDLAREVAANKLTEANANLSFSQRMLGLGTQQRFDAGQNGLTRLNSAQGSLAQINAADANSKRASLTSIGSTLANMGTNIWGYNTLSSKMNPNTTPAPGFASLPGGGSPLPDMGAIAGAGA